MPAKENQLYLVRSKKNGSILAYGTASDCGKDINVGPRTIQAYAADPSRTKTYSVLHMGTLSNPKPCNALKGGCNGR